MTKLPPEEFRRLWELERQRALCEQSLADFVKCAWGAVEGSPLDPSWHIDEVCRLVQVQYEELLQARADRSYVMRVQKTLINIPPRSLKTLVVQVFSTAWLWLKDPAIRIGCFSGTPEVVDAAARKFLQIVDSPWYQETFRPEWQLERPTAIRSVRNTAGGERQALGWNASVTGRGFEVQIIDDPIDAQAALSDVTRESVNSKWTTAFESRVNDRKRHCRIGIMQRLHELDWAGLVLKDGDWNHVKIPMVYEEREVCKCALHRGEFEVPEEFRLRDPRAPGELMHEERFPAAAVEAMKKDAYTFAGQQQQRPSPAGGGMFRNEGWRYWYGSNPTIEASQGYAPPANDPDSRPSIEKIWRGAARAVPKDFDEVVISMDTSAGSLKKSADPVAIYVVGVKGANRFVLDRVHGRMSYGDTKKAFSDICAKWPSAWRKFVEKAANGAPILDELSDEIVGLVPFTPADHGNKEQRAAVMTAAQHAGNWYLPEGAPWLEAHIEEFGAFPNGAHDDCVDACSQAEIGFQSGTSWAGWAS